MYSTNSIIKTTIHKCQLNNNNNNNLEHCVSNQKTTSAQVQIKHQL